MIKATLIKPLNGHEIGAEVEFDATDFEMLKGLHAVKAVDEPKPEKSEKPASPKGAKAPAAAA